MVNLTPYRHYYQFIRKINALRTAYVLADETADKNEREAHQKLNEHVERLIADVDNDDGIDSTGKTVSQRLIFEVDYQAITAARISLRKSVLISLYHLWERSVLSWVPHTGRKHANHDDLVRYARQAGSTGELDALRPLHFIANALKHNNSEWIDRLRHAGFERYVYDIPATPLDSPFDAYDSISLTNKDIIDFFELVENCGPDSRAAWPNMLSARQEFELQSP